MEQIARSAKQLGAIVRRQRRHQNLTQSQLGERVGLRQATISRLEAGQPAIQLQTLLDVLSALNLEITVDERRNTAAVNVDELY